MKIRRFWWIAVIAGAAALLGAWLAIPVLAAPFRQADEAASDAYTAMHEACETGDVQGMADTMDSLSEEDWEAMGEHMTDDHHGSTGSSMMGSGGMAGTGTGMMGGMMGGQSDQGMMGW